MDSNYNYGGNQTATFVWPARSLPNVYKCDATIYLSDTANENFKANREMILMLNRLQPGSQPEYMQWPLVNYNGPDGSYKIGVVDVTEPAPLP